MRTRLLIAAALAAASVSAQAQVVLTASSWVPPTHALTKVQNDWCEHVAKATSERVRCNLLPKPVAAPPGTFDAVRDGLADVSFGVHGYTPGRYVLTQLAELPFGGGSAEAASVAYQRMFEKHLAKHDEHRGLKVLAVFTHGPGHIFNTKREIASLSDLEGLRIRVGGGMINEISKQIGVNATLRPAPESYELLSSGVMDGVFFPAESIESFRLEKLIRHATMFPRGLYNTSFAFVMNPATWKKISKQDQEAISKLTGEHAARMFGRAWDDADRRGLAVMQANGVKIMQAPKPMIDAIEKRTDPLAKKWLTDAKARGLANPEQVLKEFRAEADKLM